MCGELLGRAADGFGPVGGHLLDHVGQAHDAHDLAIQLVHDRGRRAGRRGHAVPRGDFIARHAPFLHRRQVRQRGRARNGGDGQRSELARFDQSVRLQQGREQHVDLPGHDIGHRRFPAPVRNMRHVDIGERAEERAGEVARSADAGGSVGELAGFRPRESDQLLHRLGRHFRIRHQHVWLPRHLADRRKVLEQVVRMLVPLKGDVDRMA